MVIWSSPAWPSRSSSLPNALTENGQVGSRNTSNTRGPWPQTSGSARHAFFIRSFLLRLICVSLNLIRQSLLVFEVGAGGRGAVLTPELGPRPALRHPERRRRQ